MPDEKKSAKKGKSKRPAKRSPGKKTPSSKRAATIVRETEFVKQYFLCNKNGAEAARRVGYSPHSAKEIASELLTRPNVKALIEAEQKAIYENMTMSREELLAILSAQARSCFRDLGEWGVRERRTTKVKFSEEKNDFVDTEIIEYIPYFKPYNSDELSHEAALSIQSVKVKSGADGVEIEIKQRSPDAARKILAEYMGLVGQNKDDDEGDGEGANAPVTRIIRPKLVDARIRPRDAEAT